MKGDFIKLCEKDLKELETTIKELKVQSKNKLKAKLKEDIKKAAFKFLMNKKSKLSKGSEILYESLGSQNYLKSVSNLSKRLMQQIFMIRSRNLSVWCNFPKKNTTLQCCATLCQSQETQNHLYSCKYLEPVNMLTDTKTEYHNVFTNNVRKQVLVTRVLLQKFASRQKLLSPVPGTGDPADQVLGRARQV